MITPEVMDRAQVVSTLRDLERQRYGSRDVALTALYLQVRVLSLAERARIDGWVKRLAGSLTHALDVQRCEKRQRETLATIYAEKLVRRYL